MIRAVFDANVLASAFVGLSRPGTSPPAQLLRLWMLGHYALIVSENIIAEVENSAFASPYFQRVLPDVERQRSIDALRRNALIVEISESVAGAAPDPDDDHVLAAALSSQATHIVSGDRVLVSMGVYQGVHLVTPREFLEILYDESDRSAT